MKHKMKDGTEIEISSMDDEHLINTCRLLRKKAESGITVRHGGGTTAEDIWYDEDILYGEEALEQMKYKEYEKELSKRKLSI